MSLPPRRRHIQGRMRSARRHGDRPAPAPAHRPPLPVRLSAPCPWPVPWQDPL